MNIDWAALGQVFGVSLVVTVGIVALFTLGIVGTSPRRKERGDGSDAAVEAPGTLVRAGSYVCYALSTAAVAYGIHLIVG